MNASNNNNTAVEDRQHHHKNLRYYRSSQTTSRMDSANGIPPLSDNLPGSSMSVADITLTMDNEESQNAIYIGQSQISRVNSEQEDGQSATTVFSSGPSEEDGFHTTPRCTNAVCDDKTCTWHKCILKYPQYVKWEPKTITVELVRNSQESFGFFLKAREHSIENRKEKELYTLVERVEPHSKAARVGLAVGDFVRSVNHVPLSNSHLYTKVVNSVIKEKNELKMQIQRPVGISEKATTKFDLMMADSKSRIKLTKPMSPSSSPDSKYLPSSPPGEAIPLQSVGRPKAQTHLSQARVIVCGNRTNDFMQCFMDGFVAFPTDTRASYHHTAMETCTNGAVRVTNCKSFSSMARESTLNSINVDILSVANDSFFHHCCPWIFIPNCIFVLTFDVSRLAQLTDLEMARLSRLKRTVQTSTFGGSCRLQLVGVIMPGEDIQLEEIRTLFYTSLGDSLPVPDFVSVSERKTREMLEFQKDIFHSMKVESTRRLVAFPVLNAVDCLISHQNLTISNQDLACALMNWNLGASSDTEDLIRLVEDLKKTGNLLSIDHLQTKLGHVQEYLIPSKLFDCLVHIAMATDRLHLPPSGIIPRSHFVDFLSPLTSDTIKLLGCLEDLKVVFSVEASDEVGVLFPFVLKELTFDPVCAGLHKIATITMSESIALSFFLSWLSKLSGHCQQFEMIGKEVIHILLEGHDLTFVGSKIHNQISVFGTRALSQSSRTSMTLQHLEKILLTSLRSSLPCNFFFQWTEDIDINPVTQQQPCDSLSGARGEEPRPPVNELEEPRPPMTELEEPRPLITEEEEQKWLLDCAINSIPHLTNPLQEMHRHLSINNGWEVLGSQLGLTTKEVNVYAAMIVTNPNRLPSETFFSHYTQETACTLEQFLSALMAMGISEDPYCSRLAENLMKAAWDGYKNITRKKFAAEAIH